MYSNVVLEVYYFKVAYSFVLYDLVRTTADGPRTSPTIGMDV